MCNNLSEKMSQSGEQWVSDIKTILTERSTTEILRCLDPEVLRKVINIIDYVKDKILDVDVGNVALYREMDGDSKMNFCGWLEKSIEEYREYQRLSLTDDKELGHWLGRPGKKTIPKVHSDKKLDIFELDRGSLLSWLEKAYDEYCSLDNSLRKEYVDQCTWWGIKTRPQRIAYVAWLKELHDIEQANNNHKAELIAQLNKESAERKAKATTTESSEDISRILMKEYQSKLEQKKIQQQKCPGVLANL